MTDTMKSIFDALGWRDLARLLIVFYLGFSFAFAIHEIGHYLAAIAFGITPEEVRVGHWGPQISFGIKGTIFVFHLFSNPLAAASTVLGPGLATKVGAGVILAGGIIANLISAIALGALGCWLRSAAILVAALASLAMGCGQMAPVGHTDGALFVKLLKLKNGE